MSEKQDREYLLVRAESKMDALLLVIGDDDFPFYLEATPGGGDSVRWKGGRCFSKEGKGFTNSLKSLTSCELIEFSEDCEKSVAIFIKKDAKRKKKVAKCVSGLRKLDFFRSDYKPSFWNRWGNRVAIILIFANVYLFWTQISILLKDFTVSVF